VPDDALARGGADARRPAARRRVPAGELGRELDLESVGLRVPRDSQPGAERRREDVGRREAAVGRARQLDLEEARGGARPRLARGIEFGGARARREEAGAAQLAAALVAVDGEAQLERARVAELDARAARDGGGRVFAMEAQLEREGRAVVR